MADLSEASAVPVIVDEIDGCPATLESPSTIESPRAGPETFGRVKDRPASGTSSSAPAYSPPSAKKTSSGNVTSSAKPPPKPKPSQRPGWRSSAPSNIACASGSAAIAEARSSGAWRVAGPAYATSHRPSARAASTAAPPGVGHPALLLEHRYEPDVSLRRAALGAARGDAHGVAVLVALAGLAVDPAEAEQLLDRARPHDRGVRAALLSQH